jgi:hypothetical protein
MTELDIAQVEQRLAVVISDSRRKAIGYTVLTVLCTPAFLLLASLLFLLVLAYVFRFVDYDVDARGLYMGINIFLAGMIILVLKASNPPEDPHDFDKTWLAAVIVFILPLFLTHATGLPERIPVLYAIIYSVLAFVVLGLLGRVQMEQPARDPTSGENAFLSFILALSGFIAMSYGEITRGSWLWFPPKPEEVRLGAWLLCKLAIEKTMPLDAQSVPKRILNMLVRLKLVRVMDRKLRLTLKGQDFVREPASAETL